MQLDRILKSRVFSAFVAVGVMLIPNLSSADAIHGSIFGQSVTVQTDTQLVLGLQGGNTVTLHTTDGALRNCPSGPPCKAPNQGAWSTVDVGNFTGNSVYVAGTTHDGSDTFVFRDFWSFDLADYKGILNGATIESATLQVQRYFSDGTGSYVGIHFNPVSGVDAYQLTDLSHFVDSSYFTDLGGPSNGAAGLYGTYKVAIDSTADPNDVLLFALSSQIFGDLSNALQLPNDAFGHDFFTIGGSTFDASSTDGVPIAPTAAVPEPASLVMIGTGLAGFLARRKK
jgi:hypothetical protein